MNGIYTHQLIHKGSASNTPSSAKKLIFLKAFTTFDTVLPAIIYQR